MYCNVYVALVTYILLEQFVLQIPAVWLLLLVFLTFPILSFVMMFSAAAFTHLLVWSSCRLLSFDISHSPLWGTGRGLGAWEHSGAGAEISSWARLQGKLFPASLLANVTWSCMAEGENWRPPPTLSIHSHLQQLSWVPVAAESLWCTLSHAHGSCTDPQEAAPTRCPWAPGAAPEETAAPGGSATTQQLKARMGSWLAELVV